MTTNEQTLLLKTAAPTPNAGVEAPKPSNPVGVMLLFAVAFVLVLPCLRADFLAYDDLIHIHLNPQLNPKVPLQDVFIPQANSTYFPLTTLSYRFDRTVLANWSMATFGTWAPAVRAMTWVYHGLAAVLLWHVLMAIGLSRGKAFFIALIFAGHPLACETLCWPSERKNALAALFGFASLLAFVRVRGPMRRIVATSFLYMLALLSKPSALGLLPIFGLIEIFGGPDGLRGTAPMLAPLFSRSAWPGILARLVPLVIVAAIAFVLNLRGHATTLVPPPGGSLFTAVLTDFEILTRYLFNLLLPVKLSFVYFVEPIVSLSDPRLLLNILILAVSVSASLWLAKERRRAAFGWLWFIAALGTNLNLIAIPQLMQDRYVYLSLPGIFIVVMEVVSGVQNRFKAMDARMVPLIGCAYLVMLALLGFTRGAVFENTMMLFSDAIAKSPQAAHAHYGMSMAFIDARQMAERAKDLKATAEFRAQTGQYAQSFIDKCPDAKRELEYTHMAVEAGKFALASGKTSEAERYFKLAVDGPPGMRINARMKSEGLRYLSQMRLAGNPEDAFKLATLAVEAQQSNAEARVMRARAALALAPKSEAGEADTLLRIAREDLISIPQNAAAFPEAKRLLAATVFPR